MGNRESPSIPRLTPLQSGSISFNRDRRPDARSCCWPKRTFNVVYDSVKSKYSGYWQDDSVVAVARLASGCDKVRQSVCVVGCNCDVVVEIRGVDGFGERTATAAVDFLRKICNENDTLSGGRFR